MRTRIQNQVLSSLTRTGRGTYRVKGYPKSQVWKEGEGPDSGKWFYDLGNGTGDVSEPFDTLTAATRAATGSTES